VRRVLVASVLGLVAVALLGSMQPLPMQVADGHSSENTPPKWPCGIFHSPAPFGSEVRIKNDWSCDAYGEHIQVFAGGLRSNPTQGVLFVIARSVDLHRTGGGRFYGPTGAGPLTIESYKGTTLTISTATGKRFQFVIRPNGYALH
jgi:hypothetical protein